MSEETKSGEGQSEVVAAEGQPTETTEVVQTQAEDKSKDSTIQRLLKESKGYKEKLRAVEQKLEGYESGEILVTKETKKDSEKTVDYWKNKFNESKGIIAKKDKQLINAAIDVELAKYAVNAHNIDSVKKFLPSELLSISEDGDNIRVDGMKEAVDSVVKDHSYLFKLTGAPKVVTAKPGTSSQKAQTGSIKDTDSLSLAKMLSKQH